MEWDKEANERHHQMPIPPNVSIFARKQAEKYARSKGKNCVTVKEVREAQEAYADFFGREKTEEMKNMLEGKEPVPQMVEDLFLDFSESLYTIKVCPVKYGSQSKVVTDDIVFIFKGVHKIFESENVEHLIADLSRIPLCQSSRFNVVITGCSNCCESPFFSDLGIIGQHLPEITEVKCLQCKKCVGVCYEDAITLGDNGPLINRERCIYCEFCAKTCPQGKIVIGKRSFKILAGGRDYRHPVIAKTVRECINKEEVLKVVQNIVTLLKKGKAGDTLGSLLEQHGIDTLG
jgi:Fe-S-cluster-containing hydrogenase component 2